LDYLKAGAIIYICGSIGMGKDIVAILDKHFEGGSAVL